jgi:hypothetical protein
MAKRKVRVRSKRLGQLDEVKLSLAVWLIARDLVTDETTPPAEESVTKPEEPEEGAA